MICEIYALVETIIGRLGFTLGGGGRTTPDCQTRLGHILLSVVMGHFEYLCIYGEGR